MGLFDKLRERLDPASRRTAPGSYPSGSSPPEAPHPGGVPAWGTPGGGAAGEGSRGRDPDDVAIERYTYLLRTAPPETIEQAHAEAFARLTPEQRRRVLTELGSVVPATERARTDDPRDLARMATRAELRQPGLLERTFGGYGGTGRAGLGGVGLGGVIGGSLLAGVAGAFIGTAIADEIFDHDGSGGDGFLDDDGPFGGDAGEGGDGDGDQVDAAGDLDGGDGGFDAGDY